MSLKKLDKQRVVELETKLNVCISSLNKVKATLWEIKRELSKIDLM